MSFKKTAGAVLLAALLGAGAVRAGNDGLVATQPVPAGERVASYLQAYLTKICAVLETRNSGLIEGFQTYQVVVTYDPDLKDLDLTMVGTQQDLKVIEHMMDVIRGIVLKLNPKLQKNFGVTLRDGDLSMDYLFAKTGQIMDRYRDGKYLGPSRNQDESTPTPIFRRTPSLPRHNPFQNRAPLGRFHDQVIKTVGQIRASLVFGLQGQLHYTCRLRPVMHRIDLPEGGGENRHGHIVRRLAQG